MPDTSKIASIHHVLVKHLVKLRENKRYREEQGSIMVSGFKLIDEIARLTPPKRVFMEKTEDFFKGVESYQVTAAVLKKITALPSPEPIAAEFPLPPQSSLKNLAPLLVLDAIRDPGNLGTMLRTALALGWEGVFLLPTCADPFNDKVIRASRAALFQLPWKAGSWEELVELKKREGLKVYIADMEGKDLATLQKEREILLIMSNEAQGVSLEVESFGEKITIPIGKEMESLNVSIAAGILMYFLNPNSFGGKKYEG